MDSTFYVKPESEPNSTASEFNTQSPLEHKYEKYKAVIQARVILSKYGTMEERRICARELKKIQRDINKKNENTK